MNNDARPFVRRRGIWIAALVLAIPVAAIGWWLLSPLVIDRTVVEEFPRAALAAVPDDMTVADVEEVMLDAEAEMAEADEEMPETPAEPVVLVSGEISGADSFHQGSGTATIYELEDGSRVLRLDEFQVTNGPDLHVLLSPVANPESRDDVTAAGYIDLGELRGNQGSQNYEIPADYQRPDGELSVVIYCVPFHVVFASATLG